MAVSGGWIQRPEAGEGELILPRRAGMFMIEGDVPVSNFAWAAVVYSLVPFLGILFVPVSLALAFKDVIGGRRTGLNVLAASLAVLTVQILLWWLLYAVPAWNG